MVKNVCSWTFVCHKDARKILASVENIYRIGNVWGMYEYAGEWIIMHFSVVEYETLVG